MKIFVLAEKPDQAEKYAHTFGKPKNDKGVWKVYSDILNADVLIASAVGHLVEKDNPYKNYENWELENLPALPEKFSYKVKKGVSYSFNNIKKCIKECDCIIIATDPDREGESIAYKILNEIPGSINKVKYRLWANSLTKKGIESAFKKLRDPSETINYYHEAATRDGILDLIQEREYVKKEKKTGQFTPTIRGIKLIHFLDKLDIIYTNPETTQKWELLLAQIGQGKIRKSDFVEKVKWAISKQIEKGKQLL